MYFWECVLLLLVGGKHVEKCPLSIQLHDIKCAGGRVGRLSSAQGLHFFMCKCINEFKVTNRLLLGLLNRYSAFFTTGSKPDSRKLGWSAENTVNEMRSTSSGSRHEMRSTSSDSVGCRYEAFPDGGSCARNKVDRRVHCCCYERGQT